MEISSTYVREETPTGEDREFWVETVGPVRHTLEFQEDGDAIGVCLCSEVTEAAPEWESRSVLKVTLADARRMIECLERLVYEDTRPSAHPPH